MPSVLGSVAPLSLSACLSLSLSLSLALSLAVSYSFAYTHTYSRSYFLSLSTSLTNNKYSFREPLRQNSALVNFLNSCLKSTVVLEKFFLIVSSFVRNEKMFLWRSSGIKPDHFLWNWSPGLMLKRVWECWILLGFAGQNYQLLVSLKGMRCCRGIVD